MKRLEKSMSYLSKNGAMYETRGEQKLADSQYEQAQLLKEQNRLLEEQRRNAQRQRDQERTDEWRAIIAERQEQIRQQNEQIRQQNEQIEREKAAKIKKLNNGFRKKFCNNASNAGIGNPSAYYEKLMQLYCLSDNEESSIADLSISPIAHIEERIRLFSEIKKIGKKLGSTGSDMVHSKFDTIKKESKVLKDIDKDITTIITAYIILGILLSCLLIDDPIYSVLIVVALSVILSIYLTKQSNTTKYNKYLKKLNSDIQSYNDSVKNYVCQNRDQKIYNYEQRRIDNFNVELELLFIAMHDSYVDALEEIIAAEIEFTYPDFRLQYFEYPKAFLDEVKRIKKDKAVKNGVDIFEGL